MDPNDRSLLALLRRIVYDETIYLRHYLAQVISVDDPDQQGKIRVACYDLAFSPSNGGLGLWVTMRDKNSLTTPAVNDWVEIYFMSGDKNRPVCLGKANEMKDMLPGAYDGKPTTHVIFEDPEAKISLVFNALNNLLEIGNTDMQFAARINDEIKSTGSEDTAFWTWLAGMITIITSTPYLGLQAAMGVYIGANPVPASLTGKITKGSDQVKIGKA